MINVDRSTQGAPAILATQRVRDTLGSAERHFRASDARAEQRRFDFDVDGIFSDSSLHASLNQLFGGKCAFCESEILTGLRAHHLRPTQEAVGRDHAVSRAHYWWLAYEWGNLYPACEPCALSAGARFPVDGPRAPSGTPVAELASEASLLLDPCADEPSDHLVFHRDGVVAGRTERGFHTIQTFNLNRPELVDARANAIATSTTYLEAQIDILNSRPLDLDLKPFLAAGLPFAGAIRQAVARRIHELTLEAIDLFVGNDPMIAADLVTSAEAELARHEQQQRTVEPVNVERIAIRNLRGVGRLDLDLGCVGGSGETPWTMLLGENGHGKSTVLQAVALVLMGREAREELQLDLDSLIRHGSDVAEITIHVRGALAPRTLRIFRRGGEETNARFETSGDDTPGSLAAYGASRIPAARLSPGLPSRDPNRARIASLFDPHAELVAATHWLLSIDDRTFNVAARALRELTLEEIDTVLLRETGAVVFQRADAEPVPLAQLSDGYRAMFALAVDMMSFFLDRYGSMDAAEGIVLIDEIGAHLHPRWQMRIVEAFGTAFPRLQFIVTTHDPLCLRGMDGGQVVVLRRAAGGEVYALPSEEVPDVRGLRVDQLLTSEIFGLNSTTDPQVDALFDEYYGLLATPPEARDDHRVGELRFALKGFRQLGSTRRESLALQAADQFIADERDAVDPDDRRALSEATKAALREIWSDVSPGQDWSGETWSSTLEPGDLPEEV